MRSNRATKFAFIAIAGLSLCGACLAGEPAELDLRIESQPLGSALQEFAKQSGIQVIFFSQITDGFRAPAVQGRYTVDAAIRRLLDDSKLTYRQINSKTVEIRSSGAGESPSSGARTPAARPSNGDGKEGDTSSSRRFRMAEADQGHAPGPAAVERRGVAEEQYVQLQEVLVTAQKRTERLEEVPVPVSVLSADSLTDNSQLRLEDYFSSVPALNVTVNDFGAPQLTIRGLASGGYTNPTVAIVVDGVPYGASTFAGYGEEAPEIDPSDLARIEVLRGPQGTLYGASSLGGLVKFVTVDPSTDRLSGRIQADGTAVENGAGGGYALRGNANVPLGEAVAFRVSGFARQDPGYIDDPALHERGVNEGRAVGGRLSGLWVAGPGWSVRGDAIFQHQRLGGSPTMDIEPGLADLQQNDARGSGGYDKKLQAYSLHVDGELAGVGIASITGYNQTDLNDAFDYTPLFGAFTQQLFSGVAGTPLFDHLKIGRFTQEVRLSRDGRRFDWLLGLYYDHERTTGPEDLLATNFDTGAVAGRWAEFIGPSTFEESAAFADLTVHFTDRFDVQLGGRESENRQSGSETITGPYALLFNGADPYIYPEVRTRENSFTYLVTPRLRVSRGFMIYARLASGYRPGGPNTNVAVHNLPSSYKADTTENYELGAKGDWLDHRLSVDASIYYIDWKNIQLRLADPTSGETYFANGSRAKSQGVELSVQARPIAGLTAGGWVAWNDAKLTQPLPADSTASGRSGDRLPYGSKFSGSLTLQEEFPLGEQLTGYVGGALSYIGLRQGVFTVAGAGGTVTPRQVFPGYAKTDLHGGVRYEGWTINLFANNVMDRRALIGGGLGTYNPAAFTVITPRMVGLSVSRDF